MKTKLSFNQLKKIIYEGYEDLQFPLDWKSLDIFNWKDYLHDYLTNFGWRRFFTSGAFNSIQSSRFILNMIENGFTNNTSDEEFEELFNNAMNVFYISKNTNLMKDFVGQLMMDLSGKTSGQLF